MDKYFIAFILSLILGMLPLELSLLGDFIVFCLRYQVPRRLGRQVQRRLAISDGREQKQKRAGQLCFRKETIKLPRRHRTWQLCQQVNDSCNEDEADPDIYTGGRIYSA
ncbi:hypothetical protein B0H65DRAFT_264523 [Neurospora tetraspora]|uniref:Uncharacterized protein n=1 Tax=Neurospora tetraspora TaxID=94610 RepID=A0AAE0JAR5_9PEZI|nr:hypothetical protein B0H65DRAFT_264523 [Neurospora tetraspora]